MDNEVGTAHTHPNIGKEAIEMTTIKTIYDWEQRGPSPSIDLSTQEQPLQGYFNIVVDKDDVYFYRGKYKDAEIIKISKSKL